MTDYTALTDDMEAELTEINPDAYERLLQLRYGDIVETEQPECSWYHIEPSDTIIDTFARFFQRLIWYRDGVCRAIP